MTLKTFKNEAQWSQFNGIGQFITHHHCGMKRLILEDNDHWEQATASNNISERDNASAAVAQSDEDEDMQKVVFRSPYKETKTAAKTMPPEQITKKTTKQTDKVGETRPTSAATITAAKTKTEENLIRSNG